MKQSSFPSWPPNSWYCQHESSVPKQILILHTSEYELFSVVMPSSMILLHKLCLHIQNCIDNHVSRYLLVTDNFLFSFLLLFLGGEHCGIYKGSYDMSTISYLNSPSPLLTFIPPTQTHGIVTTGIIAAIACMCTHFLHYLYPPTPFPCHPSFPLVPWAGPVLPSCLIVIILTFPRRKVINFFNSYDFNDWMWNLINCFAVIYECLSFRWCIMS
jgi:hypothetical protein